MLEKLLKYHQNLLSDDFVQGVLKRIEKAYQTRIMVLGLASMLGLAVVMLALNSFMQVSWYQTVEQYLLDPQFLVYLAVAILVLFAIGTKLWFDESEFG
ncbi:MAG: hypothetical protein HWE16_03290 [Gammaproteobacteria bacterium]|nr:hypothetical protein [Gammaproteobacteria bacterium]